MIADGVGDPSTFPKVAHKNLPASRPHARNCHLEFRLAGTVCVADRDGGLELLASSGMSEATFSVTFAPAAEVVGDDCLAATGCREES